MAKMITCMCGWTIISPLGDADVLRHTQLHLKDNHPGTDHDRDGPSAHDQECLTRPGVVRLDSTSFFVAKVSSSIR